MGLQYNQISGKRCVAEKFFDESEYILSLQVKESGSERFPDY
jgi:hypothetical protein